MSERSTRNTKSVPSADARSNPSAAAATQAEIRARQAIQAGAMLRQLRQSAGIDPMLLSSALKVTLQKIQALEDGRLDDLPDLTFARGLAAAICRYFAVDPKPVLALMPTAAPGLPVEPHSLGESFKASAFHVSSGSSSLRTPRQNAVGVPGWVLAAAAVLLIGALAVWFAPLSRSLAPQSQVASGAVSVAEPVSAPEPDAAASAASAASAEASAAAPAVQASAPELAVSVASAPEVSAAGDAVEQDVVTFNATGRVWIGVRDSTGKSIMDRILNEGDSLSVGGQLPLSVTVGDKTAVAVSVRGQLLDLDQYVSKGVVARFTVDPVSAP